MDVKEWFLTVGLSGAGVSLGAWLLRRLFGSREQSRPPATQTNNQVVVVNVGPAQHQPLPRPVKEVDAIVVPISLPATTSAPQHLQLPEPSKLTFAQLRERIEAAPLMMQETIAKGMVGIVVDWQTVLRNVTASTTDANEVRLLLFPAEDDRFPCVFCTVKTSSYPQLALLGRDHPIRVIGAIESADTSGATLRSVRLIFDPALKQLPKASIDQQIEKVFDAAGKPRARRKSK